MPPSSASSLHRAKERSWGAIPQTNPEGPLTECVALGIPPCTPWCQVVFIIYRYLLTCRLMPKVQPHSKTGQSIPGRISSLFLMQFKPNIELLCEQGVCMPEAVNLCFMKSSRSCPGGRDMVTGHGPSQAIQVQCSTGNCLAGQDRMLRGHSKAVPRGGTPWRGYTHGMRLLAAHPPWQLPPLDNWQDPLVQNATDRRLATFEFPPICAI